MTVAWDRSMKPYEQPKEIPEKKIAIGMTVFDETIKSKNEKAERRLLESYDDAD